MTAHGTAALALLVATALAASTAGAAQPRACPKGTKARQTNVLKGETLAAVADRIQAKVEALRRWNRLSSDAVRKGQNLRYCAPVFTPGSVGSCNGGNLRGGVNLDHDGDRKGVGFVLAPGRLNTFGTPATVRHIRQCTARYRSNQPKGPPVNIGDISSRDGGHVGNHASHQSGRDVDLGFITKPPQSKGYFDREATSTNLDVPRQWSLVQCLLDNRETKFIFMSWPVVNALKAFVVKRPALKSRYLKFFGGSVIQGDTEHLTHLHVRFRCPKGDKMCRD
jgi:murein endopeptidase